MTNVLLEAALEAAAVGSASGAASAEALAGDNSLSLQEDKGKIIDVSSCIFSINFRTIHIL